MSEASSWRRVIARPTASAESVESFALVIGTIAFVVGVVVATPLFWGRDLAISGRGSVGEFAAIAGGLVAGAAFVIARVLVRRDLSRGADPFEVPGARLHWFDILALGVAHAVIALLGWLGLANILERSFQGAVVFTIPAIVLAGVALALSAYVGFLSGANLTPSLLSLVLAVFLVVGVIASMLSASDPLWWQMNLSALGMTDDLSAFAFNLTLVIAGVIVTTIARYGTISLPVVTPGDQRRRRTVRVLLVVIGIFLACVGIFHVDDFFVIHNSVATGMAVAFAVLVFALARLVPPMPKAFVVLGYVYVAVIVVLGVFFAIGYYNLTAVELVAAMLIFSWIIVFLRNVGAIQQRGNGRRAGASVEAADAAADAAAAV
ncbi:DUF998 domain-containing protein [Agromyces endophyticus]|uniref:DUF998 domain-containing protein n=1 Tax=Agromyces sp. H17E-10 TaxID=2932244 RepID=UPI001FD18C8B|nr:DUF998 domain-containing protein [Agromyces sp. H17E-10]UOQ87625.1 DUF998 domain-containing protein [Agromyces sp. H17E-10]